MWDQRYASEDYVYGTAPNDFLAQVVDQLPPSPGANQALCLAEGEGRNAVFLAERGYIATAVDSSAVGLEKAARLAKQRDVDLNLVHGDLADYAIAPDTWDLIVAIFAHLPPALRARVHRQVVTGLRPGGHVVLEAYTPEQLNFGTGGPPDPELLMSLTTLREELAGLEWLIARETEREVIEGRLHTGRAAVVQLLGRKPG